METLLLKILKQRYRSQKVLSKKRNHHQPKYTLQELYDFVKKQPQTETILKNWLDSGKNKDLAISIDRLDDYKGYSLDNIRVTTWKENRSKLHRDRLAGINLKGSRAVVQLTENGEEVIAYYISEHEASRQTKVNQGTISRACSEKYDINTAGGYMWKFKNLI